MAGMILFFPLNSHAQYELGYAVFHLSQKMLSEPEIVKGIDNVLYHPITLTARPKGFNKLKSAELNLLVEQYKQTDFMQNMHARHWKQRNMWCSKNRLHCARAMQKKFFSNLLKCRNTCSA